MYCHKCGTIVPENYDFCGKCGAKLMKSSSSEETNISVSQDKMVEEILFKTKFLLFTYVLTTEKIIHKSPGVNIEIPLKNITDIEIGYYLFIKIIIFKHKGLLGFVGTPICGIPKEKFEEYFNVFNNAVKNAKEKQNIEIDVKKRSTSHFNFKKAIVVGIILTPIIIFLVSIYNPEKFMFSSTIYFLWITIGIILGLITLYLYMSKKHKQAILLISIYFVTSIISAFWAWLLYSLMGNIAVSYFVKYCGITVGVITIFFLTKNFIEIKRTQSKFPPVWKNLETKGKRYVSSFGILLILCLVTIAVSSNRITQIDKKQKVIDMTNMEKEIKKKNIDKNYIDALTYMQNKDWYNAEKKFNDVIEIDPTYKEVQNKISIVKENINKIEALKKTKQENEDKEKERKEKAEANKTTNESIIKSWAEEMGLKALILTTEMRRGFWLEKIIWLDKNHTKAKAICYVQVEYLQMRSFPIKTKNIYLFSFTDTKYTVEHVE